MLGQNCAREALFFVSGASETELRSGGQSPIRASSSFARANRADAGRCSLKMTSPGKSSSIRWRMRLFRDLINHLTRARLLFHHLAIFGAA